MQQHNSTKKLVLDIDGVVQELEDIVGHHKNNFESFNSNFISIRAVERDLMIIGEAMNQLNKLDDSISFTDQAQIIGLRNLIVHAYDSIDPAVLWRILIKNLPILKDEIVSLKN